MLTFARLIRLYKSAHQKVCRAFYNAQAGAGTGGDISRIYFAPTHSLELVEAAALKQAIKQQVIESREPMHLCFDVLIQYLCTLAISEGFTPNQIFNEVKSTYCFANMHEDEWREVLYPSSPRGVKRWKHTMNKKWKR